MRRYRFGRLAALAAVLYLAVLAVLAALDTDLLWQIVTRGDPFSRASQLWWSALVAAPVAVVQAWAYWQVLRGPERGAQPAGDRPVRLLRVLLYVSAGLSLLPYPLLFMWAGSWTGWLFLAGSVIQPVIVWLFFRVLRDTVPAWWRLLILVTGLISAVAGLAGALSEILAFFSTWMYTVLWLQGILWPAWMVPLLAAQARDPRWSRGTVRVGVLALLMSVLQPTSATDFSYGEVSYPIMAYALLGAVNVFGLVWEARTAHELAGPPAAPAARQAVRMPPRAWPLPALAIALPLVPAAVNLAHGMPFWIGPRGEVRRVVFEYTSDEAALAWVGIDVLVGVGAPALLVLAVVLRRTLRLVRVTVLTLVLLAAAGAVSALTVAADLRWEFFPDELPLFPDSLFVTGEQGELSFGISPLWYSAALLASALLLQLLYGAPPGLRMRRHVLTTAIAAAVVLGFLPVSDQARGRVTTAADCAPPEPWTGEERVLTPEERYVCRIRERGTPLDFPDTTPDQIILAQGRRLCGVYTRDDPRELAREGLQRETLTPVLADICPSAAATLRAAQEDLDREVAEWKADAQRMCDSQPRHRPRIKPAGRTVIKEPQRTDYGVMEATEHTEDYDPSSMDLLHKAQENGLVAARPGHLIVLTHSDFDVCVTVETYPRRPPVETKGWDHVVEVGYDSPTGAIELSDPMSGTPLPDLSLDGRKGHYRIRVHYDWFTWKGERPYGQRLLIMAYPGRGDDVVTYRKAARK